MAIYTLGETAKMLNLSIKEVERILISGRLESLLAEDVHTYQLKHGRISGNGASSEAVEAVLRGIKDMMLNIAGEEQS